MLKEGMIMATITNACAHPSCRNPAVWRITEEGKFGGEITVWVCEDHFTELSTAMGPRFLGAVKVGGSLLNDSFR